jgi:hypothetical protein
MLAAASGKSCIVSFAVSLFKSFWKKLEGKANENHHYTGRVKRSSTNFNYTEGWSIIFISE